jgi:hypothetical protein
MGCNTSKVSSEYPSRVRRVDHYDENDNDNDRMKDDSIFSQKNIAADDALINKITNPNDQLDIQVADSQAFNNLFVQQRQQAIDNRSYRSTIESWQPKSLQQLVENIKSFSKAKSLVDCHWIIYYWIAINIEYDTVSYFKKDYKDQSAEGVFRTRKGVCAGYANLYKYLCEQLQMPCVVVSGFSKGYGFEYRQNPPTRTDHAWNAIEIDHHWYLMESTWGSGHLNEQNVFERKLDPSYFLPRPNEMIYHHFPEDVKWQLLRTPVKIDQFMQLPHFRSLGFDFKIELINPRNQVHISFLPGRPYALVLIRAPPDIYLMADLKLNGDDIDIDGSHYIMYEKRKQLYRCYFAPPNIGKYKITIFAKQGDSDIGQYRSVLEFLFDVKQIPNNIVSFPKTWKKFFDLGLEVISPQNTHIIKLNGANHAQIRIRAPENVGLVGRLTDENKKEVVDGDQVFYDRQKNIWQCQFAPDRDGLFNALILAKKKSDPGDYTSAILFKIEAKQMSSAPLSYPKTWPLFQDFGLKIEAPKNSANAVWSENGSYAEVLIQAPKDIQLSGNIEYNHVKIENGTLAQFDNDKKLWQLLFAPERTGPHELIVYAKRMNDNESSSNSVVKFNLNVTKLQRPIKFPLIYTEFQTKKCQIYSPIEGIVKKGSVVPIHCVVPGAIDVTVAVDSQVLESGGYSNPIFKRQVPAGSSDVIICAKFGQKSDYSGLVKYTIR